MYLSSHAVRAYDYTFPYMRRIFCSVTYKASKVDNAAQTAEAKPTPRSSSRRQRPRPWRPITAAGSS